MAAAAVVVVVEEEEGEKEPTLGDFRGALRSDTLWYPPQEQCTGIGWRRRGESEDATEALRLRHASVSAQHASRRALSSLERSTRALNAAERRGRIRGGREAVDAQEEVG